MAARRNARYSIEGNTARRLESPRPQGRPYPGSPQEAGPILRSGKNQALAGRMGLGQRLFMTMAMAVLLWIVFHYISTLHSVNQNVLELASMEERLNDLRSFNDSYAIRIESSIDLEEVRRIAIGELGMVYADQGQIVTFSSEGNDYMRRAK